MYRFLLRFASFLLLATLLIPQAAIVAPRLVALPESPQMASMISGREWHSGRARHD
jgi:hypothetical protein